MKDGFSLPRGWRICRVGDVCDKGSSNISQNQLGKEEGNYPIFGASGLIKNISFYQQSEPYLSIVKDGSGVGRITKMSAFSSVIGTLQYIIPKKGIDLDYLYYNLILIDFKKYVAGAAIPHIYFKDYKDEPFLWMPFPEQQRIVSILDKAFAAIDKVKTNAEQNLRNTKELFESYLQEVFGKRHKDWDEKTLKDIAFVKSGGTPSRAKKEYWEGEIAWYSSGELNELYTKDPERHINQLAIENSNAKKFPKGSLLIGMYDTAALKMSITDRDAAFNQAIAGVEANDNIDLTFIFHSINLIKPDLLRLRRGVRQKNLSLEKIKNIPISLPPLKTQQCIVRILNDLSSKIKRIEAIYKQKLNDLEELKKSLLQKAFNGELTAKVETIINVTNITPLQKINGISTTDLQVGIIAIALNKHIASKKQHSFHHVKAEKIVHLAEHVLNIDLERNPVKDAAGPNDFPHAKKVESRARKADFYSVSKQGDYYDYQLGKAANTVIDKVQLQLGTKFDTLNQLLDLLVPMTTQQAEIVATVYAAWNNLIINGVTFSDEDIVTEAREGWHEDKMKISRDKFFSAIDWIRKNELLIPKGNGKKVMAKPVK